MNIARGSGRPNRVAIAIVVVLILIVTLAPTDSGTPSRFSFAFDFGRRGLSDAILNFVLFLPLGLAIAWNGLPAVRAGIFGVLLATVIEVVQTVLPGRDPALSDIILNGVGALAGGLIGRRRHVLLTPTARESTLLTAASLVFATLVLIATAYLLSPLRRTPVGGVRTLQLPDSPSDAAGDVRPLISIRMPSAPEPIVVARSGNDLLLRYPSKGADLRFDEPQYWSNGLFAGKSSGGATRLSVTRDRSRWYLVLGSDLVTLGPSVGHGWATIAYPDAIGRRWGWVVNACWVLAIFVPIGFWARGRARVFVGIVGVMLLAVGPLLTGMVATPPLEWGGALAGFLAGSFLSRRSTQRPPMP